MDSFNKIVSFVLGLVVVIVFLAVITGRFNVKKSFQGFGQTKVSPTPTVILARLPTVTPAPTNQVLVTNNTNTTNYKTNAKTPISIPATGSPTLMLPLLFSALSLGIYFKRKK